MDNRTASDAHLWLKAVLGAMQGDRNSTGTGNSDGTAMLSSQAGVPTGTTLPLDNPELLGIACVTESCAGWFVG